MQTDKPYLSVIIPAYNEAKRITPTLTAIDDYLTAQPFTWEIIVVLDGSKDNSGEVVREFANGKANIHCIDRRENRGKGYTVRQGMLSHRPRCFDKKKWRSSLASSMPRASPATVSCSASPSGWSTTFGSSRSVHSSAPSSWHGTSTRRSVPVAGT